MLTLVAILQWQNYMTAITFKIYTSVNAYQLMLTDDIQKVKA